MNGCTECGFTTVDLSEFQKHIETHETERSRPSSGEMSCTRSMSIEWVDGQFQTPSPIPETVGPAVMAEITNTVGRSQKRKSSSRARLEAATHACPHCEFTTSHVQNMSRHLKTHETSPEYSCDECKLRFTQKSNLHRHQKLHKDEKPFKCLVCKKAYSRRDQMLEHLMSHHKNGLSYECPVALCESVFDENRAVTIHLHKEHKISATNPAACKICDTRIGTARYLLTHFQTPHDATYKSPEPTGPPAKRRKSSHVKVADVLAESDETAVESGLLNVSMSGSEMLMMCVSKVDEMEKNAVSTHDVTDDSTLTSQSSSSPLQNSTERLQNENQFVCTHCGLTFTENILHDLHASLHTNNDPFKCSLCGTQCGDKFAFATHFIFTDHSVLIPSV